VYRNKYIYNRMQTSKFIGFLFALFISLGSWAASVDKGYEALEVYDYFNAKKYFTKALKYHESPGAQGLAIIYYRDDNPFHSYDSAYVYVLRAIESFDMTKDRKKERWAKYGFTRDSLYSLRQKISSQFYRLSKEEGTVAAFTTFINAHPWAKEQNEAIHKRDSLAFFKAVNTNTSESYNSFLESYPESEYYQLAKDNYFDVQFMELTEDGTLESYIAFLDSNPESPLRPQAEKQIYNLYTQKRTVEVYKGFIEEFPTNQYIDSAWWNWYQVELIRYDSTVFNFFLEETDIPFKEEIRLDQKLFSAKFLPFSAAGEFGFMDVTGEVTIPAKYEFANFFQEGLAIVVQNGKYGFINKRGEIQIPCRFESATDFVRGMAIVEMNEQFGMIDRNGNFIFDCIYEELGLLSEGLSYALVGDHYGYYDVKGEMVIPHIFEDAYDFKNGEARVVKEGKEGVIDPKGTFVIQPLYESISKYQDTIYIFSEDDYFGLMNRKSQIIVPAEFESINPMKEGLAVASIDGRLVYLDSSGVIVIDNGFSTFPNYQLKAEFTDGISIVVKDGKYGRINTKGKILTEFKYQNIRPGKDHFAGLKTDSWGVYNTAGKALVAPQYDALFEAGDNKYIANLDDTLGVIDHVGNILVPFAFNEVELLTGDYFLVKENGKAGVYRNEELIVPVRYAQIGLFDEEFLFLNLYGSLSYYDLKKGEIVKVKQ